jgi:hypothetical protein
MDLKLWQREDLREIERERVYARRRKGAQTGDENGKKNLQVNN